MKISFFEETWFFEEEEEFFEEMRFFEEGRSSKKRNSSKKVASSKKDVLRRRRLPRRKRDILRIRGRFLEDGRGCFEEFSLIQKTSLFLRKNHLLRKTSLSSNNPYSSKNSSFLGKHLLFEEPPIPSSKNLLPSSKNPLSKNIPPSSLFEAEDHRPLIFVLRVRRSKNPIFDLQSRIFNRRSSCAPWCNLTSGLSPGREALFVPRCWPIYRCLLISLNPFHARHVREPFSYKALPNIFTTFRKGRRRWQTYRCHQSRIFAIQKPEHTTGGSVRGGARRGGGARGSSRSKRDADRTVRPGDNHPSYPPRHRRHMS